MTPNGHLSVAVIGAGPVGLAADENAYRYPRLNAISLDS